MLYVGSALGRLGLPGLQRLQRQQVRPARFRRSAAPRTGGLPRARAVPRAAHHAHRLQRRRASKPTTAPPDARRRPERVAQAALRLLGDGRASSSSVFPKPWRCESTGSCRAARRAPSSPHAAALAAGATLAFPLNVPMNKRVPDETELACRRARPRRRPAGTGDTVCRRSQCRGRGVRAAARLGNCQVPTPAKEQEARYQALRRRRRAGGRGQPGARRTVDLAGHHRQFAGRREEAASAR